MKYFDHPRLGVAELREGWDPKTDPPIPGPEPREREQSSSSDECDHTDAFGSMVMLGGPCSRYPGESMCIGCDARGPFLAVIR